ncbi:MAG TPA: tetratricopeptide repeat protein, partial [Bacteroidetes bacterium]|nr:tetratricopeptide repeat protein [Bacteroidota bacterium]
MIKKYFIIPVFLISVWQVLSAQNLEFHHNSSINSIADTAIINNLIDSALYLSSTEYSNSLLLLDEAFDLATTINYKQGIGDVYYVRSRVYYYKDNYPAAIKYLNKSKSIYQETGSLKGMANYYFGSGCLENLYGDDIKAIRAFQNAMKFEEKRKSIKGKSKILNSLASVNSKMKNYNIALNYAKKALELKKKIGNEIEISNTLTNLGKIYQQMDSLEKAESYLNEALLLRKKSQDKRRIAGSLYGIAQINNIQNKPIEAKKKLMEAYSIFKSLDEKTGQVICLLELSKAYNKLGIQHESKTAIENAISISKITKNSQLLKDSYKQYAE